MPLIQVVNLSKSFGAVDLFTRVSFGIPHRSRIALIGPNGIGKTTLLRILVGQDDPSEGIVQRSKNLKLGYLPQEAQFESLDTTLWQECLRPFQSLIKKQAELTSLEAQISRSPSDPEILDRYGRLQQEFDHTGGYTYENRIRLVLTGLGFQPSDFNRPFTQLSGGQRTRALLSRLLLSEPDLLLLDEPTNHLDIQAVEWLEKFMRDWRGALMFVSHDRYFIDQVADHVYELSPELEIFRGNYTAYLQQREDRYRNQLREYEDLQEFVAKEEEYIRRNMAGQNTRQAQGRLKRLERLLKETQLSRPKQHRNIHLQLHSSSRSGDLVVRTYGLEVGYQDENKPLFHVPDLTLKRGECAAVIGPNGAGKTTFLKTLLGQIPPFAGEVDLGASLQIGYFSQAHEGLNPEHTLMEEINSVAANLLPGEVRDYLAKFLFTGDDVAKPVSVLSGGERGRLALAKLSLTDANLLLLDEPTNHLDLPSQEVLQNVLNDYRGTILLVSHDRYLIDSLASQIWEVDPDSRKLTIFTGSYSEYKTYLTQQTEKVELTEKKIAPIPEEKPVKAEKKQSNLTPWKSQKKLHEIEEKIAVNEKEMARLTNLLADPPADAAIVQKAGQDFVHLEKETAHLMDEWGLLAEK
jgi:ATP-binding cassette, subfamily F, member 3